MPLMSKFDAEHEFILVYRLHLEWMNVDIPNLIHKLRHIQASRR